MHRAWTGARFGGREELKHRAQALCEEEVVMVAMDSGRRAAHLSSNSSLRGA